MNPLRKKKHCLARKHRQLWSNELNIQLLVDLQTESMAWRL
jgi:hypothetical protein